MRPIVRTINFEVDEIYDEAIRTMIKQTDLSETQLLRAALRCYQMVQIKAQQGQLMRFVDQKGVLIPYESPGLGVID